MIFNSWIFFILQPTVLSVFLPPVNITGGGATFPALVYGAWQNLYATTGAVRGVNVSLAYIQSGSGAGRTLMRAKQVHFGGSDGNASQAEWTGSPNFRMFPTLAGSVVLGYNIPILLTSDPVLNLSRSAIVGIFNGTITTWNDPAILSTNPRLAFRIASSSPGITTVKRSDSSGTTQIFTTALSAFNSVWKSRYGSFGSTVWPPVSSPAISLLGSLNQGVAIRVLTNTYSIGYLEQAIADQYSMRYASIINLAGSTIAPSVAGIRSAISDFSATFAKVNPKVFFFDIVDGPSSTTYPIVGFTYFCYQTNYPDNKELKTLTSTYQYELFRFFYWALTDSVAASAAAAYSFATVGSVPEVQALALKALEEVKFNATDSTPMISKVIADANLEALILSRPYCANGCLHGTCTSNTTTGQGYCLCEDTWNGTICDNRDLPVIVTEITSQPVYAGLSVLSVVLFMFTCISGAIVRLYSSDNIIRASGKNLSFGIVTFVCFGHVACLLMMELPTDGICSVRVYLIPIIISCLLFTYALKLYRVFYVFGNSKKIITSDSPAVSQLYFLGYTAFLAVLFIILASVWVYAGPYNASILRNVDNSYFYTGCATGNSTISAAIMAIYFLLNAGILAAIFFIAIQLSVIPKQFITVSDIFVTFTVLSVGLLLLFVNQLLVYSEYIKNIVFVGIFSILLQVVHYSSVLACTRKVFIQKKSNDSPSSIEKQEEQTRINLTALVDECKEALIDVPGIFVAPSSRLAPGIFSRWSDEILVYNAKSGFLTFENALIPGQYAAFSVKGRHTWIEIPDDFGIELQKKLQFSLFEYDRKHSVLINIPAGREGRARWVNALKKLATKERPLEPKKLKGKKSYKESPSPANVVRSSEDSPENEQPLLIGPLGNIRE